MRDDNDSFLVREFPEALRKIRERTPARIFLGRSGAAYRTAAQLNLRQAHAVARDAVRAEFQLETAFGPDFVKQWNLFEVSTEARNKQEYLLRPNLGRRFPEASRQELLRRCVPGHDLQIAIGDGLSVPAVSAQVPALLPLLVQAARARGWTIGQTFAIRHCRVGILNEIGELLAPKTAVLLIGERPGLATAESLSAYMAYRPGPAQTDADRNLISNIHARGLTPQQACDRIVRLAEQMMGQQMSGIGVKESLPTIHYPPAISE